jgi:hypothetical protein
VHAGDDDAPRRVVEPCHQLMTLRRYHPKYIVTLPKRAVSAASGHPAVLTQAASTAAGRGEAALRLYDAYRARRPNKVPFRQMRYIEIEHDNLESEILNFCLWCSSTAIPRFFDDNLQPRRESDDGTTKGLVTSTLSKYAGKILIAYRLHCLFGTTIQFPMNLLYRQPRMIQAK